MKKCQGLSRRGKESKRGETSERISVASGINRGEDRNHVWSDRSCKKDHLEEKKFTEKEKNLRLEMRSLFSRRRAHEKKRKERRGDMNTGEP